ncbi:MAG: serine/threonine protein kinase, partial [Myxococcales bacterium]|nr:serine/threonine protein kinase [Myxococcales bacterium]
MTARHHVTALPVSMSRRPRLRVGQRVGRYTLIEVLGCGAMGVVYRAFDSVLGRHVALKSLHVEDARSRRRFVREAQAMARLSHPNVVGVYDVLRVERPDGMGDQWLIAMELVEGLTLERWLSTPRTWSEIRDVFAGAGRGLAAAHAAGLVHRDFKPSNVLVDREGRAKVTDFGLTLTAE